MAHKVKVRRHLKSSHQAEPRSHTDSLASSVVQGAGFVDFLHQRPAARANVQKANRLHDGICLAKLLLQRYRMPINDNRCNDWQATAAPARSSQLVGTNVERQLHSGSSGSQLFSTSVARCTLRKSPHLSTSAAHEVHSGSSTSKLQRLSTVVAREPTFKYTLTIWQVRHSCPTKSDPLLLRIVLRWLAHVSKKRRPNTKLTPLCNKGYPQGAKAQSGGQCPSPCGGLSPRPFS